jgi:hypothetical protein
MKAPLPLADMKEPPTEAALLFTLRRFQKFDVAISLVGYPIPAKCQVGQHGFFTGIFRRQSQLTTFGCQCSATFGLE